jgi:hypothetical protein
MVTKLAQYTDISAALVVGGLSSSVQVGRNYPTLTTESHTG